MLPTYTVRLAVPEEAPIIAQQRRATFEDMGDTWYLEIPGVDISFAEWLRPRLENGEYIGWFALDEHDSIIGGAGARIFERSPLSPDSATRRAYINNVYVEPSHRRRGVARLLTTTILDWCRGEHIHHVTLYPSDKSRSLYESFGFENTSEMRLILR
jgi:GNAT superfamily N-acetyltransferase